MLQGSDMHSKLFAVMGIADSLLKGPHQGMTYDGRSIPELRRLSTAVLP